MKNNLVHMNSHKFLAVLSTTYLNQSCAASGVRKRMGARTLVAWLVTSSMATLTLVGLIYSLLWIAQSI